VIYHKMHHLNIGTKLIVRGLRINAGVNTGVRTKFHGCNFFRAPSYDSDHGSVSPHPTLHKVNKNYAAQINAANVDTHFASGLTQTARLFTIQKQG
jgi:hypothetical protein